MYTPHTLIEWGGSLKEVGTDDEIWANGVRGLSIANVPTPNPADLMASIAGPLATWFAAANSFHSSSSDLKWVKVNSIGADGKYSDSGTNVHDYATPVLGTAAPAAPSFLSVALSWYTAQSRPPGAFGRIYPPNYGCPIFVGSTIQAADQTLLAAQGKALLDLMLLPGVSDDQQSFVPAVVSNVGGVHHAITGCRVGNLWDTQRRRKNAVRATYISDPL
jgi:hypothetical protein